VIPAKAADESTAFERTNRSKATTHSTANTLSTATENTPTTKYTSTPARATRRRCDSGSRPTEVSPKTT
jgi:hypothetical protein